MEVSQRHSCFVAVTPNPLTSVQMQANVDSVNAFPDRVLPIAVVVVHVMRLKAVLQQDQQTVQFSSLTTINQQSIHVVN